MFKFTGDVDEMCYPFIYEHSALCDFEILTDELCTVVGLAASNCLTRDADIQDVLFTLQPQIFDLNGSIRGRCAINEPEITQLKNCYKALKLQLPERTEKFVLPRGTGNVIQLHYCRSLSKKATRALVAIEREGKNVPDTLPRFTNLLTNLFFVLTRVINDRSNVKEPEYISANYGKGRIDSA